MNLVKNFLKVENLNLKEPWSQFLEVAELILQSSLGEIYFLSVYVPPKTRSNLKIWTDLFSLIQSDAILILSDDINAHLISHRPYKLNDMGKILVELQDQQGLILVNDDSPTYVPKKKQSVGNVLDLFLVSASLADKVYTVTLKSSESSDHFSGFSMTPQRLEKLRRSSNRISIKDVDWDKASELLDREFDGLITSETTGTQKYERIISTLTASLFEVGAYTPRTRGNYSKVRPSG